jgi:mpaB/rubber oxygenase-like protein
MTTSIVLPWATKERLGAATRALFGLGDQSSADFLQSAGEPRLCPPTRSWRVCKDPLSLFIGGVAAGIMELAEPRVRTGLWEHTLPSASIRFDGGQDLRYGHGSRRSRHGQAMIARIRRMHDRIAGSTPARRGGERSRSGLVTVEYRIDPRDREPFLAAIEKLGQERRGDGAYAWSFEVLRTKDACWDVRTVQPAIEEAGKQWLSFKSGKIGHGYTSQLP